VLGLIPSRSAARCAVLAIYGRSTDENPFAKVGGKLNGMAYDLGLADRIRASLQRGGEFVEKKMFGGVAFMVNGHMCCGIVKTDLMLRLTPETAKAALCEPHTRPMDFTGRPIKSMIYVDQAGIDSEVSLEKWVVAAVVVARSRPPKSLALVKPKARSR
jgi:TfoX/Sxy family transcriptional regulator of competence genes